MSSERIILLADMESFYASVEVARNPALRGKPVAVCGDPEQRRGITLAATREAKAFGIKTGIPAWECRLLCPDIILVKPQMQAYIEVSMQIHAILRRFSDRVFPYSIDEQFLDMSGCRGLFGSPLEMAARIISSIGEATGIRCRVGIGDNPLQAKMACDRFAKKNSSGIFRLDSRSYSRLVWPLPIGDLFGVGARMERNLQRMGVRSIGHLAGLPRELLVRRWGINGEVLWLNAHGRDYSTIPPRRQEGQRGVGCAMTLPRDYAQRREIEVVLLEITEEACHRARALGKMASVVTVQCRGADFEHPTGFSRQKKLPQPSALASDLYPYVCALFHAHWDRRPVRLLGVRLTGLVDSRRVQLSLWEDREEKIALGRAMDQVRSRFGAGALFRAASLTPGSQLRERAGMIGGHQA